MNIQFGTPNAVDIEGQLTIDDENVTRPARKNDRVRHKDTGWTGVVMSAHPKAKLPYIVVLFDDGKGTRKLPYDSVERV
jgi:hypothetical protein